MKFKDILENAEGNQCMLQVYNLPANAAKLNSHLRQFL